MEDERELDRYLRAIQELIPHLDYNTNIRLEASWGAAKDILNRHMPMDECIDHLLILQRTAADKHNYKSRRAGIRYNNTYNEEMQILA
ncbi:hypothetical protein F441_17542 [Phytophthora nicotianae CJ01A1]|uniref:Uncharacterized protein n=2 Tax=Phytophthora nicotianae TaxID=4792 RepID=W2YGX8_PHYNI|nr:hypothetical protein F441_17542 [Phytophthora nicotianae CJ01A1]ETP34087.1 hypothetical protein F442_17524 [Phytophthora nicotianae P10297]